MPKLRRMVDNPPEVSGRLGEFDCVTDGLKLRARPRAAYESEDEARGALEPYLRGWAVKAELEAMLPVEFIWTETTYLVSHSDGTQTTEREITSRGSSTSSMTGLTTVFPSPSSAWRDPSADLVQIATRFRAYVNDAEPLASFAYWLLTKLEALHGSRKQAASALRVHSDVLATLGRLSAVNDPVVGRKAKGPQRELSSQERFWVGQTVCWLAAFQAAYEIGEGLPGRTLAMSDFPSLEAPP
jgi:hypothetical protein